MKLYTSFIFAFLFVIILHSSAQFEQKFAINVSIGTVNPFGYKNYAGYHYEEVLNHRGEIKNYYLVSSDPFLISNFNTGGSFTIGAQYNFNRRFSIGASLGGFSLWNGDFQVQYYDLFEQEEVTRDVTNWVLRYRDEESGEILKEEGQNEFNLYNVFFGFYFKYNILKGKRLNPYAYLELSFNYTDIAHINNLYETRKELGLLNSEDEFFDVSYDQVLEKSFGAGLCPGIGVDYRIIDNLSLFSQVGMWVISLNKDELEAAGLNKENIGAYRFDLGVRFSFLKSKNL